MKNVILSFAIIAVISLEAMKTDVISMEDLKDVSLIDSEDTSSIDKALTNKHEKLFKFIDQDIRSDVIDILKDNHVQMISSIANKESLITEQEFTQGYGKEGLEKITMFMKVGKPFLHVMGDFYKTEKNNVERKAQLILATLHNALGTCERYVDDKLSHAELLIQKRCFGKPKKITIPSRKKGLESDLIKPNKTENTVQPIEVNATVSQEKQTLFVKVLQEDYSSLFRLLPRSHANNIIAKFMDQYPELTSQLLTQKKYKRDVQLDPNPNQVINVQAIENNVLQNKDVAAIYEKYKVLKGMLEALGFNMNNLENVVNQKIQDLVNNATQRLGNLGEVIAKDLSAVVDIVSNGCCKKSTN